MAKTVSRERGPHAPACGRPSCGSPALSLSDAEVARVLTEACRPPADVGLPFTHGSRALLVEHLGGLSLTLSESSLGRLLRDVALQPHRQKMWVGSQDDAFRAKRDDVLHVYYGTPADEHILCLDEKTQMQALERRYVDRPIEPGQPVRREWEYVRHGTQVLMGAFDVRLGKLFGFVADARGGETFLELLEFIDVCYPTGRGHLVMDNLSDHDTDDVLAWFEDHPRWTRHFTPTHASWLNQIEQKFATVQRRVIARGSFTSQQDLREKVMAYLLWEAQRPASPFHWTYRPRSYRRKAAAIGGGRN